MDFEPQGEKASQPNTLPILGSLAMPAIAGLYRSEEAEKQGTFFSAARRKISIASARLPPTGLSINSGLPAAITGRACSKCLRPSMLSIKTASTRSSRAGIESTISTPAFRISSAYCGT